MKTKKKTMATKRTLAPFIAINVHDWRMSMTTGMVLGMLIVGLPQILGVALLLGIVLFALKLIDVGRL